MRYLAGRQSLLVLDNCEHLLAVSADLVETLLGGCPDLRILATSREPLRLDGEVLFEVPPLSVRGGRATTLPAWSGSRPWGCSRLGRGRCARLSTSTEEDAAVLAALCRRLDGLPLALELAAVRLRVMSLEQILDRLAERFALLSRAGRSAPQRQQTLGGPMGWCFDLCAKPERQLWARSVGVLSADSSWMRPRASAPTQAAGPGPPGLLIGLVDKSILARDRLGRGHSPYRLLETLRDFGQAKLREWGEQDWLAAGTATGSST